MARDIRLAIDMDHNPKVLRLIQELGPEAAWALVRLWLYTARHRSKGILTGIELNEIEPLVGWKRRRGRLIEALERFGFIEVNDTGTTREATIHEWFVHQPWLSGQESRSESARIAARAKWGNSKEVRENIKGDTAPRIAASSALRNASRSNDAHAPSPSPSPLPSPLPFLAAARLGALEAPASAAPMTDQGNGNGQADSEEKVGGQTLNFMDSLSKVKRDALLHAVEKFNSKAWTRDRVDQHLYAAEFEDQELKMSEYLFVRPEVAQ